MKNMTLCFTSPRGNNYVGGVMTLINGYLSHSQEFSNRGIILDLFDYHMGSFAEKLPQKVSNLLYIPAQRRAFDKYIRRNDTDIISIHTSREFLFLKDVYLAKNISEHHNKKVYLTVHVGDIDTVFNRIESWRKKLIDVLNGYVDKVIFLSNEIKDQFIQAGLDSQKCVALYNYFDFGGYRFEEKKQREELRLLFVGAIHREKGIMELLRSVEKVIRPGYPVYLDVCGQITDQSIAEEFSSIIKRTNGHIIQHGYVKGKEKADIYNAADVLVLPSYHEGMPLVILEALGAGCGIISTKVGTTPEILNDENAIWVDVGDEAGLLKAIMKVYTDREMLADMGSKNKVRSRDFTVEAHIASYCEIVNGSGTRES